MIPTCTHPFRVAALLLAGGVVASASAQLDLSWYTIDGGGVLLSDDGAGMTLSGTIGQFDAGRMTDGAGLTLLGGFWSTPFLCAGDVDGSGRVNIDDLGILLSNFNTIGGATRDMGDLDGDGNVNIIDLGELLANFNRVCL
jgi:hypothetical protein